MEFSRAEKIETIFFSRTSGTFGTFEALDNGSSRVTVDGISYLIDHDSEGWIVLEENGTAFGMHNTSLLGAIHGLDRRFTTES
jgi:hypothetical protein